MAESIDGEDLPKGAVMVKDILESMVRLLGLLYDAHPRMICKAL